MLFFYIMGARTTWHNKTPLFMNERAPKKESICSQLHKFQCVQKEEKQFPRAIKGVFFTQGLTAFVGTH